MKTAKLMILAGIVLLAILGLNVQSFGKEAEKQLSHYIVFEMADGTIRPLKHYFVQMAVPPGAGIRSPEKNELKPSDGFRQQFFAQLKDAGGQIVHSKIVEIPKVLHAESQAANGGIAGYLAEQELIHFVVRLPVIEGTKLCLVAGGENAESSREYVFDLQELAQNQLILAESQETAVRPILANGNPNNRLDLLVISEGYQATEKDKFFADAGKLIYGFLAISPFKEYKQAMNAGGLFIPSNQSGADHPVFRPDCQADDLFCCSDPQAQYDKKAGTFVDTAFNARYCSGGSAHRELVVDFDKVFAAAAAVPDWDAIVVIVNDDIIGVSGGMMVVTSTAPPMITNTTHVFGHSFSRPGESALRDEYDYDCTENCFMCSEELGNCGPNITSETDRAKIKWNYWILPDTPIPTPPEEKFNDKVGLFEGAGHVKEKMFRPYNHCMMRDGQGFCPVCRQELILTLFSGWGGIPENGIDLIEPGSEEPLPGDIFIPGTQTQTIDFKVHLLEPISNLPLEIVWIVDGVPIAGVSSDSFFVTVASGTDRKVELQVKDRTPFVHPSMEGGHLTRSRVWHIWNESVSSPASIAGPASGYVGKNYVFSVNSPGSICSLGHGVQYLFDWGDGTDSGWLPAGALKASKKWSMESIYDIKVRARCFVHNQVMSDWSAVLAVAIEAYRLDVTVSITGKQKKTVKVVVRDAETSGFLPGAQVALSGITNQKLGTNKKGSANFKPFGGTGKLIVTVAKETYLTWQQVFEITGKPKE
ncbi:MAG: M64 family metallopeptidase [bacterium]